MPKYDFACIYCDTSVELQISVDSAARPECSVCGNPMAKVYTPPTIHFKGGGWGGQ